jgi:NAD(P)-dependent dehydrogenase (short-subunit alcohol dehydrogenase family)
VLITGAGRGIGKRLAIGLANHGARVALVARSKAELDLANLEIEHAGGVSLRLRADVRDLRLRADVRDYEQVSAAVDRMRAHYGRLDVLICSAGLLGPIGPLTDNPVRAWTEAIETNVIGVMNSVRAVLPHMLEKRSGKIIVLGGRGAGDPRPNFSAYATTKAAVARFVETVAEEVRDRNVQINLMSPGRTYTHMTDEILRAGDKAGQKEHDEAVQVRITGGMSPDRQVELALFLASEDSNHVSGKFIHVNDDWKRLEHAALGREIYTLRRIVKG